MLFLDMLTVAQRVALRLQDQSSMYLIYERMKQFIVKASKRPLNMTGYLLFVKEKSVLYPFYGVSDRKAKRLQKWSNEE